MSEENEIKTEDLFRDETIENKPEESASENKENSNAAEGEENPNAAEREESSNAAEGKENSGDSPEAEDEGNSSDDASESSSGETGEDESGSADDASEEGAGETDEDDGRKGGRLNRRAKKELAKKDEEIANLTDQYRRAMAEFDNYRKRTEKEKAAMYGMGVRDIIEKILPVVDNFERGLGQVPEDGEADPFTQGMQAIYKQFMTVLDGIGVKPIEAVGKAFDPAFHNAVMHVDDETMEDNVVVEEFQKGYLYQDQVVRYSMVKVAN